VGFRREQYEDPIALPSDPNMLRVLMAKKREYEKRTWEDDSDLLDKFKFELIVELNGEGRVDPVDVTARYLDHEDYDSFRFAQAVVVLRDYATTGGKNVVPPELRDE
jgi:hypothetical protein